MKPRWPRRCAAERSAARRSTSSSTSRCRRASVACRVPGLAAHAAHRRRHARVERPRFGAGRPRGCRRAVAAWRRHARMPRLAPAALRDLAERALRRAGASAAMAAATAQALIEADAQGLGSHGVARIPQYAAHLQERPRRRRRRRARRSVRAAAPRWWMRPAASRFRPARSPSPKRSGGRANSA